MRPKALLSAAHKLTLKIWVCCNTSLFLMVRSLKNVWQARVRRLSLAAVAHFCVFLPQRHQQQNGKKFQSEAVIFERT